MIITRTPMRRKICRICHGKVTMGVKSESDFIYGVPGW